MLTQEEKIIFTELNLKNAKLSLMEITNTKNFDIEQAKKFPHLAERFNQEAVVLDQDIKKTEAYIEFLHGELNKMKLHDLGEDLKSKKKKDVSKK